MSTTNTAAAPATVTTAPALKLKGVVKQVSACENRKLMQSSDV